MRKVLAALVLVVMLVPSAYAVGMGGFYDASYTGVSVKQAKTMLDDAYVVLKGNILKRLTADEYLFSDGTGTITVEIDEDDWAGQTVQPSDKIEITGEIDKTYRTIKIDVETLRILQE